MHTQPVLQHMDHPSSSQWLCSQGTSCVRGVPAPHKQTSADVHMMCLCLQSQVTKVCTVCIHICHLYMHTHNNFMYDMQMQSKFIFNIQHLGCIYTFIFNIHIQHYLKKCAYCIFVTPKELDVQFLGYLYQYDNITPGSSLKLTLSRTLTICFPKAPTPKLLLPKDVPWDIPRYRHDLQDLQLHPQGSGRRLLSERACISGLWAT